MNLENVLWNSVLSIISAVLIMVLKAFIDEQKRLQVLLNRTREEVAKEYVTKVEVHADINRVLDRLDRLDAKLDRLMEAKHA